MSGRESRGGQRARLGIGLPVFNGADYVGQAIESLLGQGFGDLRLYILDNASTDDTGRLCRAFAESDPRVRYIRNAQNIGAAENFNKAFRVADEEYFKWAAHDDLCAPGYLERCIEVLDSDPGVVLCHSLVRHIDDGGRVIKPHPEEMTGSESGSVPTRFREVASLGHWCFDVFGVIRRRALEGTALIGPYYGSDRILLAELALKGRFHRVRDFLFLSRDHSARSIRATADAAERMRWFKPGQRSRRVFPYWRNFGAYFGVLRRADLSFADRWACYVELARWFHWHKRILWQDLVHGGGATFDRG